MSEHRLAYVVMAVISRFIQGAASTLIQTTLYSIITNQYNQSDQLQLLGYLQGAEGSGVMAGPLIGALLYMVGGYSFVFYTFGLVFLVLAINISYLF